MATEIGPVLTGFWIVSATAVAFVAVPEVPFTVTVYVPGTVVVLAAKANVLVVLVVAGLNVGVTPAGSPAAVRATGLLEALRPETPMVVLAVPPVRRVRVLSEGERVKLGTGMVRAMVVELVRVPDAPITLMV